MEMTVLRTFKANEKIYEEFSNLCKKEHMKVGNVINSLLEDYIKTHGDGNPTFTLDQFAEDEGLKACPAFFRKPEAFEAYLKKCKTHEILEFKKQLIKIDKTLWKYL